MAAGGIHHEYSSARSSIIEQSNRPRKCAFSYALSEDILHAMESNHRLQISYKDFFGVELSEIVIEPYALRMFKRRWYVLAHVPSTEEIRRFALDRIISFIELTENVQVTQELFLRRSTMQTTLA